MADVAPVVAVEVELSGAGGGWTALGNDVLRAGIVLKHGIQGSQVIDRVASTGTASFFLNNSKLNSGATQGYYSPAHASVRSGWALGIGCRVRITDPATATTRTMFLGRLDRIDPAPGVNRSNAVAVMAADWMDEAARWTLTADVGQQVNVSWDAVLTDIIGEMSVAPAATSLASGSESYASALDSSSQNTFALKEFSKLANSEFGYVYLKADGTLVAEDRHQRMTTTASVWTLTDSEYQELELPSTRDDLINTVRVTTHPKIIDTSANHIVYEQENIIEFAASQTRVFSGPYRDDETGDECGATDIQPLAAGVDYTFNTAANGSGSDVSTSIAVLTTIGTNSIKYSIFNGTGATAYLTSLRVTGKRILDHGSYQHEASDATSVTNHGEHVVTLDMPYQSSFEVGQGAADFILAKYKNPLAHARSIVVWGRTSALLTQILTRDVGDRITLSETMSGVADDFYINAVELTIVPEGFVRAQYTLTTGYDPFAGAYFQLDTSALDGPDILAPF